MEGFKISRYKTSNDKIEIQERIDRGKRIKYIREQELKMTKTMLGKKLGISSQFLGLVEDGKGNLMYRSLKKLRQISGHSSDYILYGLDDNILKDTNRFLERYSEFEIINAINILRSITFLIRKDLSD